MKKFLALILLFIITACNDVQSTNETYIENSQNEKIYLRIEGLENAKHHKLAFLQHGLASNMNHQVIQAAKRAFLNNNYVVVTFDSRYSLGNSGNDVQKVTLQSFEDDLKTVTSWAKKQSFYAEPFALSGHSMGGATVLSYSAEYPEKVDILIPIAPVISGKLWEESCMQNMQDFCTHWKDDGFHTYRDPKNHKIAIIPYNVVTSFMNYDANVIGAKITAKTLVISAQNDKNIDVEDINNLTKIIPNGQTSVIHFSGHNFNTLQNQDDLYRAINNFLQHK